jgi:hypothetical protein
MRRFNSTTEWLDATCNRANCVCYNDADSTPQNNFDPRIDPQKYVHITLMVSHACAGGSSDPDAHPGPCIAISGLWLKATRHATSCIFTQSEDVLLHTRS